MDTLTLRNCLQFESHHLGGLCSSVDAPVSAHPRRPWNSHKPLGDALAVALHVPNSHPGGAGAAGRWVEALQFMVGRWWLLRCSHAL